MQQLTHPPIFALFFWLTFFSIAFIEARSGVSHEPRKRTRSGLKNDLLSVMLPSVGMLLAIVLKATHPDVTIYDISALFWFGLLIAWSGTILRLVAIKTLGKFFVMTIITQPNQTVISAGPYRFIRHPSYLGGLVAATGLAVALNYLPGIFLIVGTALLTILVRIRLEEKYLMVHLGAPYKEYMSRTERLIPFIW